MCGLSSFGWQSFVVEPRAVSGSSERLNWSSQRNSKRALLDGVVAVLRAGMAFGQIGGVGGDFVGDHAVFDVLFVRQSEVFFRVT